MGIIALVFVVLMLIGVPIAFVLGSSALTYYFFFSKIPLEMIGQKLYGGADNFVLLSIFFFILAGELRPHHGRAH